MIEVVKEDPHTVRFQKSEIGGRLEDRVRKVANRIGTVNIRTDNRNSLRLEFGTEEGADKMMEMIGTLA